DLDREVARLFTYLRGARESWKTAKQWGKMAALKQIHEKLNANRDAIKQAAIDAENLNAEEADLFEREWYERDVVIKKDWKEIANGRAVRAREDAVDAAAWQKEGERIAPAVKANEERKKNHDAARERRQHNYEDLTKLYTEFVVEIAEF